jgi:tripartite-type tricarboxylate transporter receptor subunit TctC
VAAVFPASQHATPAQAQSKDFYDGRQIRFIVHTAAGGGYDQWSRLVTRYWGKHIPGTPTFVVQNMPGGGGLNAANYMFNQAPRDGSVIGMIGRNLPLKAVLKDKAVRFDPEKFGWIGNPEATNYVCAVKSGAPAETAEQAFQKEILMAGAGSGTGTSTTCLSP